MKRIAASLILAIAASSASALEFSGEMYVVGSLGRSGVNQTEVQVNNNNIMWSSRPTVTAVPGWTANMDGLRSAQSTSRNGYKLQLGYEFTPNLAVEGGYVNLGKTDYAATYNSRITYTNTQINVDPFNTKRPGSVTKSNEISGFNIAGVGIYPLNPSLSVFAKLGMFYAKVKQTTSGSGDFYSAAETDDSNAKGYLGFGATYYPYKDRNFGIRAEYEKFLNVGDSQATGVSDISLMTVGLTTKF